MTTRLSSIAPHGLHLIRCRSCATRYDPAAASICDCATEHRTLQCPACTRCSCSRRAADVRENFATAPPDVLRQLRSERAHGRRPVAAPETLRRPLVVVADDNFDIRATVKRVLESRGYGVIVTSNGEDALDAIRTHRPELALLDGLMPRLDGRMVAQRVRDDAALSTRCVLMTSLYTSAAQKEEAFRVFGIDAHLSKPVKPELLERTLRELLPSDTRAAR